MLALKSLVLFMLTSIYINRLWTPLNYFTADLCEVGYFFVMTMDLAPALGQRKLSMSFWPTKLKKWFSFLTEEGFSSRVFKLINFGVSVVQEKIWDYFQTEGVASFSGNAKRLRFILSKIKPNEKRVLNIGVGNGYLEVLLLKNGKTVYALDPSSAAIENLKKNLGLSDAVARVGYSQEIPFVDGSMDVVDMSEVIEHLDDEILAKTLGEVRRVLRRGGRFIGTVPAEENLKESECVCPKCGHIFHRWGHIQHFDEERLAKILGDYFIDCEITRHFFGDPKLVNWKGKIGYFVKNLLMALGIKGGGETFFFIAHKGK